MPVLPNQRHERFAQELVKGKTADEAYELAGYERNRKNASRLKTKEDIQARMRELQRPAAARAEVTVQTILDELKEARNLAIEWEQAAAAVSASMGRAKVAGLIVDKGQVSVTHAYEGMTDEELFDEARRLDEMTDAMLTSDDATQH